MIGQQHQVWLQLFDLRELFLGKKAQQYPEDLDRKWECHYYIEHIILPHWKVSHI